MEVLIYIVSFLRYIEICKFRYMSYRLCRNMEVLIYISCRFSRHIEICNFRCIPWNVFCPWSPGIPVFFMQRVYWAKAFMHWYQKWQSYTSTWYIDYVVFVFDYRIELRYRHYIVSNFVVGIISCRTSILALYGIELRYRYYIVSNLFCPWSPGTPVQANTERKTSSMYHCPEI